MTESEGGLDQFFQWISQTPVAGVILIALAAIMVLAVVAVYLMAFRQGREISLWPPKVGATPTHSEKESKGIPIPEGFEIQPNRVASVNSATRGIASMPQGLEGLENSPHGVARPSLRSIRLSSKPIAILVGMEGAVGGTIYILETSHRDITVGSELSCDLPVSSNFLSRYHFRIRISLTERAEQAARGFHFELIDSGSTNGTMINGQQILKPTVIENGDRIEAGDCGFRFFSLTGGGEKDL